MCIDAQGNHVDGLEAGSGSSSPAAPPEPAGAPPHLPSVLSRPLSANPDILRILSTIQEQVDALQNNQRSTHHTLDGLQGRPIPEAPEAMGLAERLDPIEDKLQALIEQAQERTIRDTYWPRGQSEPTISSDSNSDHLRYLLQDLDRWREPARATASILYPTGPPIDQQPKEILSSGPTLSSLRVQRPPPLVPFVYPAAARNRPGGPSPELINTVPSQLYTTASHILPRNVNNEPSRRPARRVPRLPRKSPGGHGVPILPSRPTNALATVDITPEPVLGPPDPARALPPGIDLQNNMRCPRTQTGARGPVVERFVTTMPPDDMNGPSQRVPAHMNGRHSTPSSSHRPARAGARARHTSATPSPLPPSPGQQHSGQPDYLPMPPGPPSVHLLDPMMAILQETRLAQLATVGQQREVVRYIRGLNEWLERDEHDRQIEYRGVIARMDQLGNDVRQLGP